MIQSTSLRPTPGRDGDLPPLRAAPHNFEAEQALLGAILVNNAAHDRVSDFLEPSHFYDPLHQRIYEVATRLIAAGKQATPITRDYMREAELRLHGHEVLKVEPRMAGE